jgi:hypothetical protein
MNGGINHKRKKENFVSTSLRENNSHILRSFSLSIEFALVICNLSNNQRKYELISLFKLKAIKARHFATAVLKFTVAL